jgi:hypothetical protein
MSRSRYTKIIHEEQRVLLARQEKALADLARELRRTASESAEAPVADDGKERRRSRLESRRLHKPKRDVVGATSPVDAPSMGVAA